TRFKGEEAAELLSRSRARVLFTVSGFLDIDYVGLLRKTELKLPDLGAIVVVRGEPPPRTLPWRAFLAEGDRVPAAQAEARASQVAPEDVCDLMFTSGTTGQPKGVPSTHAQTLRAFRDWAGIVGLRAGDRYLVVVPFFHSFGYKAGWLAALMMGAT